MKLGFSPCNLSYRVRCRMACVRSTRWRLRDSATPLYCDMSAALRRRSVPCSGIQVVLGYSHESQIKGTEGSSTSWMPVMALVRMSFRTVPGHVHVSMQRENILGYCQRVCRNNILELTGILPMIMPSRPLLILHDGSSNSTRYPAFMMRPSDTTVNAISGACKAFRSNTPSLLDVAPFGTSTYMFPWPMETWLLEDIMGRGSIDS